MRETIKTLINRQKAKKEHQRRLQGTMWNTHFNQSIEQIKNRNKQILLNNLMTVTNTSPDDITAIVNLDNLIELNKREGVITELYTRPEKD